MNSTRCLLVAAIFISTICLNRTAPADPSQTDEIVPDDLLEITLRGVVSPNSETMTKRVNAAGQISLPYVGPMDVKGLTLDELARQVSIIYAEAHLVPNAAAQVNRIESGRNPSIRSGPMNEGDYVRVRIWDLMAPNVASTIVKQVAKDGTIELPFVGKCRIEGLSEIETEKVISKTYRDANLVPNAAIECLRVTEEQSKATSTQPAEAR